MVSNDGSTPLTLEKLNRSQLVGLTNRVGVCDSVQHGTLDSVLEDLPLKMDGFPSSESPGLK